MRNRWLIAILLALSTGCTTASLRRNTVEQADTFIEMHYRQVMENLAMVANDPEVLPSYSLFDYGSADVTDKVGMNGSIGIPPKGAAFTAVLDPLANRSIKENWTLTPVVAPEKLRALHLTFLYAVYGDPNLLTMHDHRVTLDAFCYPWLVTPQGTDTSQQAMTSPPDCNHTPSGCKGEPGYYFNVKEELSRLPPCWLHVGSERQVPKCVRFTTSCGSTHVWVNAEDMSGLSYFSLIVKEIARASVAAAYYPKASTTYTFNATVPVYLYDPQFCPQPEQGYAQASITLPVDCYGNIVAQKDRLEGINFTDNKLKSSLGAGSKAQ